MRDTPAYKHELGLTVVNFCRIIPGGVLCFFPSYQTMQSCIDFWKSSKAGADKDTIYQSINAIKSVIIEPKQKQELPAVLEKFASILGNNNAGAIFFRCLPG